MGRYLKEQNPDIKIIGVDPVGSLYYDYFHTGQLTQAHSYLVEGIGEDFLPTTMDFEYVDDVIRVNDKECFQMTRDLVRREGLFCGVSSGAAVAGGLKYLRRHDRPDLTAVILLPDSGSRYLSKVYNDNWMRENGLLETDSGLGTVDALRAAREERNLVTVDAEAQVTEVIGLLKVHGVSQLPVTGPDGQLIGIITEKALLERALEGDRSNVPVRSLVAANFCTVSGDTDISVLTDLFRRAKVAIVVADHKPVDIITRIDLIDFISRVASR
jgi:cystathionine beta-synthase